VTFNVFDDNDGIVDDQPDREHNCQQGEEIEGEPEELHQKQCANERNWNRDNRDKNRSKRSEEEEDYDHHDEQMVDQRFYDFVNGIVDVGGGVVGHLGGYCAWGVLLCFIQVHSHSLDYIERGFLWEDP